MNVVSETDLLRLTGVVGLSRGYAMLVHDDALPDHVIAIRLTTDCYLMRST